jgi:hypothetical protein
LAPTATVPWIFPIGPLILPLVLPSSLDILLIILLKILREKVSMGSTGGVGMMMLGTRKQKQKTLHEI